MRITNFTKRIVSTAQNFQLAVWLQAYNNGTHCQHWQTIATNACSRLTFAPIAITALY